MRSATMPMHHNTMPMRSSAMPMRSSAMPMHPPAMPMRSFAMPMRSPALKTLRFYAKLYLEIRAYIMSAKLSIIKEPHPQPLPAYGERS
ncbi:hypothetical protein [Nostoc sp.]|uniref:hypothetical protein n=1 Tax=Nostoc sp. TaxID=1180 RepID=UPI002FF68977